MLTFSSAIMNKTITTTTIIREKITLILQTMTILLKNKLDVRYIKFLFYFYYYITFCATKPDAR